MLLVLFYMSYIYKDLIKPMSVIIYALGAALNYLGWKVSSIQPAPMDQLPIGPSQLPGHLGNTRDNTIKSRVNKIQLTLNVNLFKFRHLNNIKLPVLVQT